MIEHIWTIACAKSIVDRESNSVSLIDVLEGLKIIAPKTRLAFPVLMPIGFHIVSVWARSDYSVPEQGDAQILFQSPSASMIGETLYKIDLSDHRRTRNVARIAGLPILEPGKYLFRIRIKHHPDEEWKEVAVLPLDIEFEESMVQIGV